MFIFSETLTEPIPNSRLALTTPTPLSSIKCRIFSGAEPTSVLCETFRISTASSATSLCPLRPWQFVVVDDRDTLAALSKCKPVGAHPVAGAAFAVVVAADPERSECFVEDMSIAAVFMQLQAEALGIGSCWIQVRGRFDANDESSEDIVRDIVGLPPHMVVECIVTFGYKNETRRPVDPAKLMWEKVHINTWKASSEAE